MNRRIRGYRSAPPTWIGPVLWLLAVAFLVLTILILVKTSPNQIAPVRPGPATVIVPNREGLFGSRTVVIAVSMASVVTVVKGQLSATPMRTGGVPGDIWTSSDERDLFSRSWLWREGRSTRLSKW
jgi:hypothetical protein